MGISTTQITVYTCDLCGSECIKEDGEISIPVNNGDGRDVGPATIDAKLVFNQPYGCHNGVVCGACKFKWLWHYLDKHAPEGDSQ
jgi:hypothetical protein